MATKRKRPRGRLAKVMGLGGKPIRMNSGVLKPTGDVAGFVEYFRRKGERGRGGFLSKMEEALRSGTIKEAPPGTRVKGIGSLLPKGGLLAGKPMGELPRGLSEQAKGLLGRLGRRIGLRQKKTT